MSIVDKLKFWTSKIRSSAEARRKKERARLAFQKYYARNKEAHLERCNKWQAKNKEKVQVYCKKYVQENKLKVATYRRKWAEEHQDKVRAIKARYYQNIKNDPAKHKKFKQQRRKYLRAKKSGSTPTQS